MSASIHLFALMLHVCSSVCVSGALPQHTLANTSTSVVGGPCKGKGRNGEAAEAMRSFRKVQKRLMHHEMNIVRYGHVNRAVA